MIDEEFPLIEFTAHDRCDGCGAQAYHLATSEHGDLLFCLHHGKANVDRLVEEGWAVTSDYEAIERLTAPATVPV